jgi:lipoprotein signal peptidase
MVSPLCPTQEGTNVMTTHDRTRRIGWGLTAVMAADLATKLAVAAIAAGHTSGPVVPVRNHEFSLGVAAAPLAITILLAGLGIALAAAFTLGPARRGELPTWIPACVLGGSLANLVDRAAFGSVHDFLATPWIVFNLADIAVAAGLVGFVFTHTNHPRTEDIIPCAPRPLCATRPYPPRPSAGMATSNATPAPCSNGSSSSPTKRC